MTRVGKVFISKRPASNSLAALETQRAHKKHLTDMDLLPSNPCLSIQRSHPELITRVTGLDPHPVRSLGSMWPAKIESQHHVEFATFQTGGHVDALNLP